MRFQKECSYISPTTSSYASAKSIVAVKCILFTPQDIEQKISIFNDNFIQVKEHSALFVIYRVLAIHVGSPLNSMISCIFDHLKANRT